MTHWPTPIMVRLEYWNWKTGQWGPGHENLGLIDPQVYLDKLMKNGFIARTTDKETGEVLYPEGAELL